MSTRKINAANKDLLEINGKKEEVVRGNADCFKKTDASIPKIEIQPCFELKYGDAKGDQIESEDYEVMTISAVNPYSDVLFEDLTIISLNLKYIDGKKEVDVPTTSFEPFEPLIEITPSRMIGFGDLKAGDTLSREVVLATFRTRPGDYAINLECSYEIRFTQAGTDKFTIPVSKS